MCILFIRSETNERKKMFFSSNPFLKKRGGGDKNLLSGKSAGRNPLLIGNYKTLDSERNKLFFTLKGSVFFPQYYATQAFDYVHAKNINLAKSYLFIKN